MALRCFRLAEISLQPPAVSRDLAHCYFIMATAKTACRSISGGQQQHSQTRTWHSTSFFYYSVSECPDPTWSTASRSSAQRRYGFVGADSKEDHEEYSKSGATILQRRDEKAEVVQPSVEKALGTPYYSFPVP